MEIAGISSLFKGDDKGEKACLERMLVARFLAKALTGEFRSLHWLFENGFVNKSDFDPWRQTALCIEGANSERKLSVEEAFPDGFSPYDLVHYFMAGNSEVGMDLTVNSTPEHAPDSEQQPACSPSPSICSGNGCSGIPLQVEINEISTPSPCPTSPKFPPPLPSSPPLRPPLPSSPPCAPRTPPPPLPPSPPYSPRPRREDEFIPGPGSPEIVILKEVTNIQERKAMIKAAVDSQERSLRAQKKAEASRKLRAKKALAEKELKEKVGQMERQILSLQVDSSSYLFIFWILSLHFFYIFDFRLKTVVCGKRRWELLLPRRQ